MSGHAGESRRRSSPTTPGRTGTTRRSGSCARSATGRPPVVPEWEALREAAAGIKAHTLSRLADYLEEFERNATANGSQGPLGSRCRRAQRRSCSASCAEHGVKRLVKTKSMLTEECHLNPYLEAHGIEVDDTDLGERIVQLRKEPPSHIVLPAIHIKKEEIGELFHKQLGTEKGRDRSEVSDRGGARPLAAEIHGGRRGTDRRQLRDRRDRRLRRLHQRRQRRSGRPAAEAAHRLHGNREAIPRAKDLAIFLRLLARSATGQPITTYSSHFHGPCRGGELHIVLVDNGRSSILGATISPLAQLHSLRRVHEHLPGLSPQRRTQLRIHDARADRFDSVAAARSEAVRQPAVRLQPVRLVHRCLPGEDRSASPVVRLPAGVGDA